MNARQHIFRERRHYNQWVANETLEDYALRFTSKKARRWSSARVANTALGAISFLALEAIGGAITLQYGFTNAVTAIAMVGLIIFATAIPISYYAARYGVDSDLLARGAGFGYIGSTITSLIYATFTFIFFALEAVIMAMALELLFAIPLALGYIISALAVIPLVTHGITLISRFQLWSQPVWITLQLLPFIFIIWLDARSIADWTRFAGHQPGADGSFNLLLFGAASAVMFSLIAQIGEQVDFLRFVPARQKPGDLRWWAAVMAGGPGWIVIGAVKMLAGSFLAVLAVSHGIGLDEAANPTHMYLVAFGYVTSTPEVAVAMAGIFIILCQVKINVTNAYAGSIAWSNFFSRLTRSHPGRVVWLVFNVAISLLVMYLGVYRALEETLGYYGIVAIGWAGALVADLVINKPLGLSPRHIEFKRAHLYDINPVGVGAMLIAIIVGAVCFSGVLGETARALAHFIALASALAAAPAIALATRGRYYLAREPVVVDDRPDALIQCSVCENRFETEDMTSCPAYGGNICSLCCTLEARCDDQCKPGASYREQIHGALTRCLPTWVLPRYDPRVGHFLGLMLMINGVAGLFFLLIYQQSPVTDPGEQAVLSATLWQVFAILLIITGVVSWLFTLAHDTRRLAQEESLRQNRLLIAEIDAHEQTDQALQQAKEHAETANQAKSRYLTGISHELRSPLNAVLGYAQLLERDESIPLQHRGALAIIRRSGEYLADLIEGLLDISKIEAGRLELHREEVRLDLLLEQLVDIFRLQAGEKGLRFDFYCDRPLPARVMTDEKRLRQILINLLSNAIKYTRDGHVALTVNYRSDVAEFLIEDSGEGIDANDLERIFLPFERVRSTDVQASGTGLGLTISRLLTGIMGGEISIQSTLGRGSRFRLALMLTPARHEPRIAIKVDTRDFTGYSGQRRRILVVDDDSSHRQLMDSFLLPLGFEVTTQANPLNALDQALETRPDLLLLDVSMPGLDGWQLLRAMRESLPDLPIIMISADAREGQDECPPRCRHDGYFIKPVQLQALAEHIGTLLELEWTGPRHAAHALSMPQPSPGSHRLPGTEQICKLLHLAAIGHRKGLLESLYGLREANAAGPALIEELIALTRDFQFELIRSRLKVTGNECAD